MDLTNIRRDLEDLHVMMRDSIVRHRDLIDSSQVAIDESRALSYEVARRHPEIDFDLVYES